MSKEPPVIIYYPYPTNGEYKNPSGSHGSGENQSSPSPQVHVYHHPAPQVRRLARQSGWNWGKILVYGIGAALIGIGVWLASKKDQQLPAATAIGSGAFLIVSERRKLDFLSNLFSNVDKKTELEYEDPEGKKIKVIAEDPKES
jgi:hypothetical protein